MKFSKNEITFLTDVPSYVNIDMTSGWRIQLFNKENLSKFSTFLEMIEVGDTYLIIPRFTTSVIMSDVKLELSDPFLVNNETSPDLILNFIINQWNKSGFSLKKDVKMIFSIKYKRVYFN